MVHWSLSNLANQHSHLATAAVATEVENALAKEDLVLSITGQNSMMVGFFG